MNPQASKLSTEVPSASLDTLLEDYSGSAIIPKGYKKGDRPLLIPTRAFVDNIDDIDYLNEVRECVRSWFCCYVPVDVQDKAHGPDFERQLNLFQDLDEFLGTLATANYRNLTTSR